VVGLQNKDRSISLYWNRYRYFKSNMPILSRISM